MGIVRPGVDDDDISAGPVCDPHLVPVEDIVARAIVARRPGLHAHDIAPCAHLRHGQRADLLAAHQPGEEAGLGEREGEGKKKESAQRIASHRIACLLFDIADEEGSP